MSDQKILHDLWEKQRLEKLRPEATRLWPSWKLPARKKLWPCPCSKCVASRSSETADTSTQPKTETE